MLGTIRKKHCKGYGFIKCEESNDVFFHASALVSAAWETIAEGMTVEFDLVHGERGVCAENVKVNQQEKENE